MKTISLLTTLIFSLHLMAQWEPTEVEKNKIYDHAVEAMEKDYLKKHPVIADLTVEKRADKFLKLINQYRTEYGLKKLSYVSILDSACSLHTNWMLQYDTVSHLEVCAHKDGKSYPLLEDRIKKYNKKTDFYNLMENCQIAEGTTGNNPLIKYKTITEQTIYKIFIGWKNSPGHNAVMLSIDATHIGFFAASKYEKEKNNYFVAATLIMSH